MTGEGETAQSRNGQPHWKSTGDALRGSTLDVFGWTYCACMSIDDQRGEVWHAYVDPAGRGEESDLSRKIGSFHSEPEARSACIEDAREQFNEVTGLCGRQPAGVSYGGRTFTSEQFERLAFLVDAGTEYAEMLRYAARLAREKSAQPVNVADGIDWRHIANEWADEATNGPTYVRNVRDGIRTADELIEKMKANFERIRALVATPQTATAAVTDEMVERGCKWYSRREDQLVFPNAYSDEDVRNARAWTREFLEHVLRAPRAGAKENDHDA